MEIHQLRYFVEVARQKNFSRAAELCHVAQPSLSQQIKKLEDEFGQPLLRRSRRGAELTEFGESILPQALQILSGVRNMSEEAEHGREQYAGRVTLGAIPTVAPYVLPKLIQSVLAHYPRMKLNIVEHTTDELVAQLQQGSLDFALLSPPFVGEPEMESVHLTDDELLVVLPEGHALADRELLKLHDLSEFPMVLMKDVHCLRRQSVSLCETSGLTPKISLESAQMETVIAMVEVGMGFSFVPKMAQSLFNHRAVKFLSVAPATVTRGITLTHSKYQNLSPTQLAFQALVQQFFENENERTTGA